MNNVCAQEYKEFTQAVPDIEFLSATYLGNETRNYYGNTAPTKLDVLWKFSLGGDMDGTPVVTHDSALLITLEKQYITGKGGVFK
jgi:phosphoenolpyruvate carboxylase